MGFRVEGFQAFGSYHPQHRTNRNLAQGGGQRQDLEDSAFFRVAGLEARVAVLDHARHALHHLVKSERVWGWTGGWLHSLKGDLECAGLSVGKDERARKRQQVRMWLSIPLASSRRRRICTCASRSPFSQSCVDRAHGSQAMRPQDQKRRPLWQHCAEGPLKGPNLLAGGQRGEGAQEEKL